jgi:hypothetical protein
MFISYFKLTLFKYIKSQYLSYLARDLLNEVVRNLHVEKFGNPCTRHIYILNSSVSLSLSFCF